MRQYAWWLSTGDFRVTLSLHPVEFALWACHAQWQSTLSALTWQGKSFVKRVDAMALSEGLTDVEKNRGIKGWSCVWVTEVEMHFATKDLQAFAAGTIN